MCICKASSSSLKSKTTNRIVNKSMPPPATPPRRPSPKQVANANKGMRPPPFATAAAAAAAAGSNHNNNGGASKTSVSFDQLSSILDPFFVDTCNFLKQSPRTSRQDPPTPTPTAAATDADIQQQQHHQHHQHHQHQQRIESAYLSPWCEAGVDALDRTQQESKVENVACVNNNKGNGGGALQDFLSLDNSAWMETVQHMEAEKNDMLRLDVRARFF